MEQGIPYGDLIVLGAIAAFIILRYRAMLGEGRGRDPQDTQRRQPEEAQGAAVIQLPRPQNRVEPEPVKESAMEAALADDLRDGIKAIRARDASFNLDEFLDGAKAAFDMVIDAFNTSDYDTLRMLLAPDVYKNFEAVLKEQEASGRIAHTTLVAIRKAELETASITGNNAAIAVAFESSQIHLVKDKDGAIIEGNPSAEERVSDRWVFTRDVRASAPDWKISET